MTLDDAMPYIFINSTISLKIYDFLINNFNMFFFFGKIVCG